MLAKKAASRLARRRAARSGRTEPDEFLDSAKALVRLSPHLVEPTWLAQLASVLDRAFLASCGLGPPVRACISVPSQHGKTLLVKHALAEWLRLRPQDPLLYASYGRNISRDVSGEIRVLAQQAGVELRQDARSLDTWLTPAGGGLRARAVVGGAITGAPGLRLLVVDDPFKGRVEAESPAFRAKVWKSFTDNIFSRLQRLTSVIVLHTRWHERDLIGSLQAPPPDSSLDPSTWEFINIQAVSDPGEGETLLEQIESMDGALWSTNQPIELLREKRAMGGEYSWWSIYMGQPRPREGKLFFGYHWYAERPSTYTLAVGVDLAYSARTSSHWSVAVVMAESAGRYYVLEVVRRQCAADDFAAELDVLRERYPQAPFRMYIGDSERGSTSLMSRFGVAIAGDRAADVGDKFVRAQPVAAAWRLGRVLLPGRETPSGYTAGAPWVGPFSDVVLNFTGLGGEADDDVDAMAAAFDALPQSALLGSPPPRTGARVAQADRVGRDRSLPRGRNKLGVW